MARKLERVKRAEARALEADRQAQRKRWLDAANLVSRGQLNGIRCPSNEDADLAIDKLFENETHREYRLRCPGCGATEYLLQPV